MELHVNSIAEPNFCYAPYFKLPDKQLCNMIQLQLNETYADTTALSVMQPSLYPVVSGANNVPDGGRMRPIRCLGI